MLPIIKYNRTYTVILYYRYFFKLFVFYTLLYISTYNIGLHKPTSIEKFRPTLSHKKVISQSHLRQDRGAVCQLKHCDR